MKVTISKDSTDFFPYLYEGSVLQDVKEEGKFYVGTFSSFIGSYEVEVPKKRCKVLKEIKQLNNIKNGKQS